MNFGLSTTVEWPNCVVSRRERFLEENSELRSNPFSVLQQQEQDMTQLKLKYEKTKLEEKNILIIQGFDDSVEDLKLKRFNLEINIKAAELKMMCLYQAGFHCFPQPNQIMKHNGFSQAKHFNGSSQPIQTFLRPFIQ